MVLFKICFIGETCFLCLLNCAYFLSSVTLPAISARSSRVGCVVTVAVGWVTFLGGNLKYDRAPSAWETPRLLIHFCPQKSMRLPTGGRRRGVPAGGTSAQLGDTAPLALAGGGAPGHGHGRGSRLAAVARRRAAPRAAAGGGRGSARGEPGGPAGTGPPRSAAPPARCPRAVRAGLVLQSPPEPPAGRGR